MSGVMRLPHGPAPRPPGVWGLYAVGGRHITSRYPGGPVDPWHLVSGGCQSGRGTKRCIRSLTKVCILYCVWGSLIWGHLFSSCCCFLSCSLLGLAAVGVCRFPDTMSTPMRYVTLLKLLGGSPCVSSSRRTNPHTCLPHRRACRVQARTRWRPSLCCARVCYGRAADEGWPIALEAGGAPHTHHTHP